MLDRAPYEMLKPPGAAEVVLCTACGSLLEGLVTNVFVVEGEAPMSFSNTPCKTLLQMPNMSADCLLRGICQSARYPGGLILPGGCGAGAMG